MKPEERERLTTIAGLSSRELDERYTNREIEGHLRLIRRCAYSMECPEKFRGYVPNLGGRKADRIRRISDPNYAESRSKSRNIQECVVQRICSADLANSSVRTSLIDEGWTQVPNSSGRDVSNWCFGKPVVEHYLVQLYSRSDGNPFTMFKIDTPREACHALWANDIRMTYRVIGGRLLLGFQNGFMEGFSSFIDTGREMVECDSSKSRAVDIDRMQFTQESEAEAHNLAIIWHLFREKLLEFLRIPGDSKPLFKGSHRMKDSEIGQVEIDGTIAWIERQSQGRIILETKGNRSYSRGWDVGFSTHQLIRPFRLLTLKTEEHRLPCEITPVFCRFEEGEDGQTWNALLDVYEIRADDTISWQRGIDFTGIPSQ